MDNDRDSWGRQIKEWLNEIFKLTPNVEKEFERTSASIYDKIRPIIEEQAFRPNVKSIVRQLDQWGIFNPIPDSVTSIYEGIYKRLSADVHVIPDRTDIGKRILSGNGIFDQVILQDTLSEYVDCLHRVVDVAIVVELNIARDLIEKYDETKTNLRARLDTLDQLGLKHSLRRVKELLR